MFRPTHLVILFAVVLCAAAFPADPVPDVTAAAKEAGKGLTSAKESVQGAAVEAADAVKGDLDTDATVHFGYAGYYGPRWGYYGPGWGVRSYGWGPYGWY